MMFETNTGYAWSAYSPSTISSGPHHIKLSRISIVKPASLKEQSILTIKIICERFEAMTKENAGHETAAQRSMP